MAITDENLWHSEERLWLEGSAAYGELVDEECLFVMGEPGILGRDQAIIGLIGAPRWSSVEIRERHVARPGKTVAVLAYKAEADRDGESYEALCSSTYRGGDDGWKLVQHQQTVIG